MEVLVVDPPAPIVTPGDIPGFHAEDDPHLVALIQAATEEIDGPEGWVGRAFGVQTIEARLDSFGRCGNVMIPLPCCPIIDIVSVTYVDPDGADATMAADSYGVFDRRGIYTKPGHTWPKVRSGPDAVIIQYRAGYDGDDVSQGGTGKVPERARQAIILAVREMSSLTAENLFLRSEEVEGIGTRQFVVSEVPGKIMRRTAERLLSTLRVYG